MTFSIWLGWLARRARRKRRLRRLATWDTLAMGRWWLVWCAQGVYATRQRFEEEHVMQFNCRNLAVSGSFALGFFFAEAALQKLAFIESQMRGNGS